MRRAAGLVFDEQIVTGIVAYTSTEFNEFLGSADHLALQVIAADAQVPSATTMQVAVFIETSADGMHWALKASGPEVPHFTLSTTATTVSDYACDADAVPSMKYVRLRVTSGLTPSGTGTGTAHVRVYVTLRDTGRHKLPKKPKAQKPKKPVEEEVHENPHIYHQDPDKAGHKHGDD